MLNIFLWPLVFSPSFRWDKMPESVTNAGVESSSYVLFGAATAGSLGLACYSKEAPKN